MAAIKHARGVKLLLKLGNGADPEVFTAFCSVNAARGITFTAGTREYTVVDCTDPDAVAWMIREKESLSAAFNGAGMLNTPDVATFFSWLKDENSRNCQVVIDVPAIDGGLIFNGAWHLTEFAITGDKAAKQECSITCASDGEITSEANS